MMHQVFHPLLQTGFNNDKHTVTWHPIYFRFHFYFHKIIDTVNHYASKFLTFAL